MTSVVGNILPYSSWTICCCCCWCCSLYHSTG